MSNDIRHLVAGDEATKTLTLLTKLAGGAAEAADLSGAASIVFTATPTGAGTTITKSLGTGLEFATDGSDGQIVLSFDPAELVVGNWTWRIRVTWADGTGPIEGDILSWPSSDEPAKMYVAA